MILVPSILYFFLCVPFFLDRDIVALPIFTCVVFLMTVGLLATSCLMDPGIVPRGDVVLSTEQCRDALADKLGYDVMSGQHYVMPDPTRPASLHSDLKGLGFAPEEQIPAIGGAPGARGGPGTATGVSPGGADHHSAPSGGGLVGSSVPSGGGAPDTDLGLVAAGEMARVVADGTVVLSKGAASLDHDDAPHFGGSRVPPRNATSVASASGIEMYEIGTSSTGGAAAGSGRNRPTPDLLGVPAEEQLGAPGSPMQQPSASEATPGKVVSDSSHRSCGGAGGGAPDDLLPPGASPSTNPSTSAALAVAGGASSSGGNFQTYFSSGAAADIFGAAPPPIIGGGGVVTAVSSSTSSAGPTTNGAAATTGSAGGGPPPVDIMDATPTLNPGPGPWGGDAEEDLNLLGRGRAELTIMAGVSKEGNHMADDPTNLVDENLGTDVGSGSGTAGVVDVSAALATNHTLASASSAGGATATGGVGGGGVVPGGPAVEQLFFHATTDSINSNSAILGTKLEQPSREAGATAGSRAAHAAVNTADMLDLSAADGGRQSRGGTAGQPPAIGSGVGGGLVDVASPVLLPFDNSSSPMMLASGGNANSTSVVVGGGPGDAGPAATQHRRMDSVGSGYAPGNIANTPASPTWLMEEDDARFCEELPICYPVADQPAGMYPDAFYGPSGGGDVSGIRPIPEGSAMGGPLNFGPGGGVGGAGAVLGGAASSHVDTSPFRGGAAFPNHSRAGAIDMGPWRGSGRFARGESAAMAHVVS